MESKLDEKQWTRLLKRIRDGKCTPFLGAGVNYGILPLGSDIAKDFAKEYEYPLDDYSDLARVAQFLAISQDPMYPKEEILDMLSDQLRNWEKTVTLPDFFKAPDEPLSILAQLPIPIYMTTNYDNLMMRALEAHLKKPRRELCRWNKYVRERLKDEPSFFDSAADIEPSPATPVVFHLHGHDQVPESLVLTENDYLDFLVNISRQQDLLPPRIQEALAGTTLLFIGYQLADWDFRVLFRGLVDSMEASLRRISVAVQLPPNCPQADKREYQQKYLSEYFSDIKVEVYWGTAKEFTNELGERWRKFNNGS